MEKWGYVTFTGSHTIDQRAKVIDDFRDRKDAQIMIASLRTGGTGLNLTMACRMIMIDLWWNTVSTYWNIHIGFLLANHSKTGR